MNGIRRTKDERVTPTKEKPGMHAEKLHANLLVDRNESVLPKQTAARREAVPRPGPSSSPAARWKTRSPQKRRWQRLHSVMERRVPGSGASAQSARENKSGIEKSAGV